MERVGDRQGKIERYCSRGQSPQRAVGPTDEEEEEEEEEDLLILAHIEGQPSVLFLVPFFVT
jgi:hypothetical protein